MKITNCLAAIGLGLNLTAGVSLAAEPLTLLTDQTQLLPISGNPGTVVVGNPSVADVTLQGQYVFLHGRAFGTTNIIILDQAGNALKDFEVTVRKGASNDVTMFKAGQQYSYVCAPECESTLHMGDQKDYFAFLLKEAQAKSSMATGKASSEADEPAPAQ